MVISALFTIVNWDRSTNNYLLQSCVYFSKKAQWNHCKKSNYYVLYWIRRQCNSLNMDKYMRTIAQLTRNHNPYTYVFFILFFSVKFTFILNLKRKNMSTPINTYKSIQGKQETCINM